MTSSDKTFGYVIAAVQRKDGGLWEVLDRKTLRIDEMERVVCMTHITLSQGASEETLTRRMTYKNRKGRRAKKRLSSFLWSVEFVRRTTAKMISK